MAVPHDQRTEATHPHTCIVCGRRFGTVWSRAQHEQQSHGIKCKVERDSDRLTEADWQTWMRL